VLQDQHLTACITYLRQRYTAALIFVVENLPGSRGGELAHQTRDVSNSITMREYGQDKRPGVPKDRVKTQTMGVRTRRLLQMRSIHFSSDMGTYPCDSAVENARAVAEIQHQICDQLLAFEIDEHGRWTGKNGATGRDDVAVALMMCYYWAETFMESSQYEEFRIKN